MSVISDWVGEFNKALKKNGSKHHAIYYWPSMQVRICIGYDVHNAVESINYEEIEDKQVDMDKLINSVLSEH